MDKLTNGHFCESRKINQSKIHHCNTKYGKLIILLSQQAWSKKSHNKSVDFIRQKE